MIPHPAFLLECAILAPRRAPMWRRFFVWLLSTVAPILVQQAAEKVAKPKPPAPAPQPQK